MEGYVYFIRAVGTDFMKIGYTGQSIKSRMNGLNTACPHDLECLFLIESARALEIEQEIHGHMAHFRKKGEWFKIDAAALSSFLAVNYPQHVSSASEIHRIVGETKTISIPTETKPMYETYYTNLNTPHPGNLLFERDKGMGLGEIDKWKFQYRIYKAEQALIRSRRRQEKIESFLIRLLTPIARWWHKLNDIKAIIQS